MSLKITGLTNFISEVRTCTTVEEEMQVVEYEKQKIREQFSKSSKMNNYGRMKCLWKMVYMKLLGHNADFCIDKATELISSTKLGEKYTGYIVTSILVGQSLNGLYEDIVPIVKNDIYSDNQFFQSIALSLVGNMAATPLASKLVIDITTISLGQSDKISFFIRKKAILTLLRIFRKFKNNFPSTDDWGTHIVPMLGEKDKLSFINCTLSLVQGVISLRPSPNWEIVIAPIVSILESLVIDNICPMNYKYYGINCPIIQVKALKILSSLPVPKGRTALIERISALLNFIVANSSVTNNPRTNNTVYSIMFEAINVIIHYKSVLTHDLQMMVLSLNVAYMGVPQPNIRYLSLDSMTKVLVLPGADEAINEQLKSILDSLKDKDTSIRRRALDLLYLMCTYNNVGKVVEELLNYTEETDMLVKEELVLKIAILAERFAPNLTWYIDVIIRLLTNSGDYINDDIWHRVIQIITGFGKDAGVSLRQYAATLLFNSLSMPHVHETLVKVGSYVLAEFGSLICDQIGTETKLFNVIHKHFDHLSHRGKAMLLNSYAKLAKNIPTLNEQILPVFELLFDHWDPDIQLRAIEYHMLLSDPTAVQLRDAAFKQMPTFPVEIQDNNPLLTKMINLKAGAMAKEGEDPTLSNEAHQLVENQKQILKARLEQVASTNPLSGMNYEDLFIEQETISMIKFSDFAIFEQARSRMALVGPNLMLSPPNIALPNGGVKQIKECLLGNAGYIYEDPQIKINFKSEVIGAIMKVALQFETKSGALNIHRALVKKTEGLKMNVSPIKVAEHPQLIINIQCIGVVNYLPILAIKYNQNAQERMLEFGLPIFAHHFIRPHQIPPEKYEEFYSRYTTATDPTIFKMDEFVKNPASTDLPLSQVLKKIGSLLGGGMHLNANPYPNPQNIIRIWATGQYCYQPEGEEKPVMLPILAEIEGYEQDKGTLRLSLRCGGNPYIIYALYQLFKFYLYS